MSKFTPGPWWVSPKQQPTGERSVYEHGESFLVMSGPIHFSIGEISGPSNFSKQEEMRANARLVSAAPDLLEASKSAYEVITELEAYKNGYQWAVSAAAQLNRAIKKAEGEKP